MIIDLNRLWILGIHYLLPIAYCLLLIIHHLSLIIHHLFLFGIATKQKTSHTKLYETF